MRNIGIFYIFSYIVFGVYSSTVLAKTFEIQEPLIFCDQPVPLSKFDIYERLDTQLRMMGQNTGQIELWSKRKHRYFPVIMSILSKNNYPEDLKYVPVIESSLQIRARSYKNAVGPWQFIASTGRRYGLRINNYFDERLDIRKSTLAAINYLGELYDEYKSWPTALAAYNIGENRIREECYRQGTQNYFEMLLPNETDRYVMNIIAAKIILEKPQEFKILEKDTVPYNDTTSVEVTLNLSREFTIPSLAYCMNLSYREFRRLNPWIIGVKIPAGKYTFWVPEIHREGFETRIMEFSQKTSEIIRFRHARKLKVTSEIGEMRLGPDRKYPVFRILDNGTTFRVKTRTKNKDNGHYWYLFVNKNGAHGWIWGSQVD